MNTKVALRWLKRVVVIVKIFRTALSAQHLIRAWVKTN